jgi:hypothetical protein
MKSVFKPLVLLGFGILTSLASQAEVCKSSEASLSNWVPFPWAQELPFTWSTAQGVWMAGSGHQASYFYIRVTKDRTNNSIRYLAITERDRATCRIIATGFGTEEKESRIVADMKYSDGARSRYRMMLRLYDPGSVPGGQGVSPFRGKVMVLTIMSPGQAKSSNYPMTKVSDRTEYPCAPIK